MVKETDEPTDMKRMLPHTEVTLPGVAGVGVGMLARGPPVFFIVSTSPFGLNLGLHCLCTLLLALPGAVFPQV